MKNSLGRPAGKNDSLVTQSTHTPQMAEKVSYSDIYTMICTVDTHF